MGLVAALGLAGCAVEGDPEEEAELTQLEGVAQGAMLFNQATFGGNGTTCKSCHQPTSGTLSAADVEKLFKKSPNDPLFQHDRADVIGGNTFNRFRAHATVLIDRALPPNISIVGSSARSVILPRGIPTTNNTASMDPIFMYDGRDETLQAQAQGAITAHAQGGTATQTQLNDIALFQQTLFNRQNVKSFVQSGTPLSMPAGGTAAEIRGRRWFIDPGLSDMDSVGESPTAVCGWCHSGDNLNGSSAFFGANIFPIPEGSLFNTALVSELNPLGNPVYLFEVTEADGTVNYVESPDPGGLITQRSIAGANLFKVGSLWGIKDTAPYFHDASSATLAEMAEHYDIALNILCNITPGCPEITGGGVDLTTQDKADIVAYLKLL